MFKNIGDFVYSIYNYRNNFHVDNGYGPSTYDDAEIISSNPNIKFTEEDGVWIVDKKRTLQLLPDYKIRDLAKNLKVKHYSYSAISAASLRKKLLAHPDLEDALYILASGHENDKGI